MGGESSYGLTTFSPSGALVQIEYAMNAIGKGATTLGVKALDGVVLVAEKKPSSSLIDTATMHKMYTLDEHVGVTYSGIGPDSRVLIDTARKACQVYRRTYNEPIPCSQLVREIADTYQEFTQSGGVRPFGCSLLLAGQDTTGLHLYQLDPSGAFLCWKAVAIGRNASSARTFLEKRYSNDIELEDAVHTALLTLKEGFDGQITNTNCEVARVTGGKFEILTVEQTKDYLDQI